ncbi:tRNA pseudouridine(55) synthase TruB [Candidatus Uhrbacteria bacterium CG_4_10_14_0_8_um_filter_58_22]|uniref:tRNA pseudouridine synthase B n=1 Tax=Candidatus Uhrbacteria bacterium CG_4_10_14_0_8_um_filter_58_22 TaxID=1975029 RepID=A0A2M7Q8N3_9BACT|nr:MAG: tRNA pseudouridine(55) synthase TruB [Parcubacteria group bacterium CG1_02_58_44]PIY61760.1 MAG: tRNA pseudouridine(55) synthase TruB [Candidatus Uhrbacteria bacterium CG_4_10_14_0_8_um_filter_58_22]
MKNIPETNEPTGFLLIDKPTGLTSHDVVQVVRRVTGIRRVGHGGTLDPFATGLLVVGVGRAATRELQSFIGKEKEYEATMRLGAVSDTQDLDGKIEDNDRPMPTETQLLEAMKPFKGTISQIPPMYSAKQIDGRRLYELARAGQTVERQPVELRIAELELLSFNPPLAKFRVRCSAGTYVRTLAHDIGQNLGCGAYLIELRRTAVGSIRVSEAVPLDELTKDDWVNRLWRPGESPSLTDKN